MVQAGCRAVTAEPRIRSYANPSGNFSVKFGIGTDFFPRALILPCQHNSPSAPSSVFIHVILALYSCGSLKPREKKERLCLQLVY